MRSTGGFTGENTDDRIIFLKKKVRRDLVDLCDIFSDLRILFIKSANPRFALYQFTYIDAT